MGQSKSFQISEQQIEFYPFVTFVDVAKVFNMQISAFSLLAYTSPQGCMPNYGRKQWNMWKGIQWFE